MRSIGILCLCLPFLVQGATVDDFSGTWRLNESRSEVRALPIRPAQELRVDAKETTIQCQGLMSAQPPRPCSFATDGREMNSKAGEWTVSTRAKWEGAALLVNAIHIGRQRQHTEMDRWKLSRDGRTLTIRRTVISLSGGETESTLVYEKQL